MTSTCFCMYVCLCVCLPQQCMLLLSYIFHVSDPRRCTCVLPSVAQCVSFSWFIKIPQLPSTGQDTHLLPSNPHSRPPSTLSGLSLGLSAQDKNLDKQEDLHANTPADTHKYRSTSYRLLCKSRGSV